MAIVEPEDDGEGLRRLGGFELISKIAEGGMGAVYKARQVSLDRTVAVKILPKRLARDEQFVARFLREAKLAARFSHPNIVGAVDAGEAEGVHYFAMEYVEGESLGETLRREKLLPEPRAVEVITQIARALECAHKHSMIHRDVKPDNVLIDEEGTAKLADLGLARQVTDDSTQLTQAGTAMGSPHYISPEQARGEPDIDVRADIYSLGATFYHLVTGATAFGGQTAAVIMTKHINEAPPFANEVRPEVSARTSRVIAKMMAKDRSARYPTPAELLADLERLARGEEPQAREIDATFLMEVSELPAMQKPKSSRRLLWVAAAGATVAVAAIVLVWLLAPSQAGNETVKLARLLEERELDQAKSVLSEGAPGPEVKALQRRLELALEEREVRLKAEALAAELDAIEGLLAEEKFAEALRRARAGAEKFPDNRTVFEQLATRLGKMLDEEKREKEREKKRAEEFGRLEKKSNAARATAEALMAKKAYAEAAEVFSKALEVEDDPELRARRTEALFLDRKSRGRSYEAAGELEAAMAFYGKALATKPDPALGAHLKELKRSARVAKVVAEALGLEGEGEFARARKELSAALAFASAEEKEALSRRIGELASKEKAYEKALAEAWAHLDACRLDRCMARAKDALVLKPGDQVAERVLAAAKGRTVVRNSIGMSLVYLPGGEFTQGSDSGDADERPAHRVRLSHFYCSKTEVTNRQYERWRPAHCSQRKYSEDKDSPVVRVTWHEARDFCEWLSAKEGVRYSLPTEAQWEYAATGAGANSPYPWGGSPLQLSSALGRAATSPRCNIGWAEREKWGSDGHVFASPAGSFPKGASPQGVVDLIGNVWEWCLDWYSAEYYRTEEALGPDPVGPARGEEKVLRGGSFIDPPERCRSRYRSKKNPAAKAANFGFRIVREAR